VAEAGGCRSSDRGDGRSLPGLGPGGPGQRPAAGRRGGWQPGHELAPRQNWGLFIELNPRGAGAAIDQVRIRGGYPAPRVLSLWTDRDETCAATWPWHGQQSVLRSVIHYHVGIRHYAVTASARFAACLTDRERDVAYAAVSTGS
jgi:hypothetical protein